MDKEKINSDYINKWFLITILITSLISTVVPFVGLIPTIISAIALAKYKLVKKEAVPNCINLKDIENQISLKEKEYNHMIYEKNKEYNHLMNEKDKEFKTMIHDIENKFNSKVKEKENEYINIENKVNDIQERLNIIQNEQTSELQQYNFERIYPFEADAISSSELKNTLSMLKLKEKESNFVQKLLNDEDIQNKKHEKNQEKQLVTLFNVECENIFNKLTLSNYNTSHNKLIKRFEALNKLFSTDGVAINKEWLNLKLEMLSVYHEHAIKLQQESEIRKAEKEQLLEEQKVQRELDKKRDEIAKEEKHFNQEINKLMKYMQKADDIEKQLYVDKINELNAKLSVLEEDRKDVEQRQSNTRAGYVYIISNIGSFGENVYKIGMTRRLEPMDRIKELGDASVPFTFDVHALIFSEDAPRLENILHSYFRDQEINKVNHKKEFFKVNIEEIEKVVKENYNETVNFVFEPQAEQYRESLRLTAQ